jgi:hypothetical protein
MPPSYIHGALGAAESRVAAAHIQAHALRHLVGAQAHGGTVVAGEHHDRVLCQAEGVQFLQQLCDAGIHHFIHGVRDGCPAGDTAFQVRFANLIRGLQR